MASNSRARSCRALFPRYASGAGAVTGLEFPLLGYRTMGLDPSERSFVGDHPPTANSVMATSIESGEKTSKQTAETSDRSSIRAAERSRVA